MNARVKKFEEDTGMTAKQAAVLLAMNYSNYMQIRRGDRGLQKYTIRTMDAILAIPQPARTEFVARCLNGS